MEHTRIVRIEWGSLEGRRPRKAGSNARLGEHGLRVTTPIARITTADGATGFGWSRINQQRAEAMLGSALPDTLVHPENLAAGIAEPFRAIEYPLLDLAAKLVGKPVYACLGATDIAKPLRVPCYDTSLYIDDLHIADEIEAAEFIAGEAAEGLARGHTAFKIKVGRGAMHMPVEDGIRRDIAVIRAVRRSAGTEAPLMIDANNGYNLNLTRRVLAETADVGVYWMEEPFHEDGTLYTILKNWLAAESIPTLIADGEGDASPRLLDWARQGLIDVVQYDVRHPGFSHWLELGPILDAWGRRSAPHNYGEAYGNYASCHLAPVIAAFERVEWDAATVDGLDASAYTITDGAVNVPPLPGFGLALDLAAFDRAVHGTGFAVSL
ncbi:MAG: mandelate racemase [Anaerolineae bacterium]|nr:mandelate racemase [Anaerolineae bacterium]